MQRRNAPAALALWHYMLTAYCTVPSADMGKCCWQVEVHPGPEPGLCDMQA